jgi:hypothetical protein
MQSPRPGNFDRQMGRARLITTQKPTSRNLKEDMDQLAFHDGERIT